MFSLFKRLYQIILSYFYLDYTIDFKTKNMQYATKDTLVLSSRAVQGGKSFEIEIR